MQPKQDQNKISFSTLLKTIMVVSSPSLLVLSSLAITGELNFGYFMYGYIAVMIISGIFVVPFLGNISALTDYVNDLALDKRVRAPDLSFLSNVGQLSGALGRLQNSW